MHRYSYRERDYAFGQRSLPLRMQIGLTQTGLAELLHLTKRAVGEWKAGSAYPKMEHLKALITVPCSMEPLRPGRRLIRRCSLTSASCRSSCRARSLLLSRR